MADYLRASGAYLSAGVEGPAALAVSGAYLYVGLVGPLSTVPPAALVSGAFLSVGVQGPPKLEVSGVYVYVGLIGPLDDPNLFADYSDLLPAMAARGQALDYWTRLFSPIDDIRDDVAWIAASFADIDLACEGVLDLLGDLEGEPRDGLTDDEYRQIIEGRRSARYGAHSLPGVWAGWLRTTGVLAADARILTLPPASVLVWADYAVDPTTLFVRRAGIVMGDSVPAGYQIDAYIAQPLSAFWGTGLWGVDEWCYTLLTR